MTRTPIADLLRLDPAKTATDLADKLRQAVADDLRRRGVVVAMSGGVDSSVCAALAVAALGADRLLGVLLPESESPPEDERLAKEWAQALGVQFVVEDITPILESAGCYRRRDEAIRRLVPEFGRGWGCKIGLGADRLETDRLPVFQLTVRSPVEEETTVRLPADAYREIVAATNFKQRARKMLEYYHADRLHYAVLGTPNRLEYDQGFFVKGGDGLADVKPIAHLYKTQVYQLAEHLGVPASITKQAPTTGTYSLSQTQEEFYFSLPLLQLDIALYGYNHGLSHERVADELGLPVDRIERVYRDIERKRATTRYQHLPALLLEKVEGLE